MQPIIARPDALRREFTATAEQVFQVEFGVANPQLIDYLSQLLIRFVHIKKIFSMRNSAGRQLTQVVEMITEAEECEDAVKVKRYQHIGDFILFWTGYYPEALKFLKRWDQQDMLIDYREQGKRSYYIASTYRQSSEALVLRQLSDQFEVCSAGLHRVRQRMAKCHSLSN